VDREEDVENRARVLRERMIAASVADELSKPGEEQLERFVRRRRLTECEGRRQMLRRPGVELDEKVGWSRRARAFELARSRDGGSRAARQPVLDVGVSRERRELAVSVLI